MNIKDTKDLRDILKYCITKCNIKININDKTKNNLKCYPNNCFISQNVK